VTCDSRSTIDCKVFVAAAIALFRISDEPGIAKKDGAR
jgi:hypothetical protein